MTILTSKTKYWPQIIGSLAIFGLIVFLINMFMKGNNYIHTVFFLILMFTVFIRKVIRQVTFDGSRLEISYMQWGYLHRTSLDAADILVSVGYGTAGRNMPYQYLKITDQNHRQLYMIKTGDGFELEDFQAFAEAFQHKG
jgi:hypothetical protein